MEIFVGNLAPEVTEDELLALFKPFGQVKSAEIKREMFTGVSKGFAFLEMPGKYQSIAAINGLNGKDLRGQPMRVNEARTSSGGGRPRRR